MVVKNFILSVTLAFVLPMEMPGQIAERDTLSAHLAAHHVGIEGDKPHQFEWRQTILPVSLMGVGTLSLAPSFIKNGSRKVTNSLIDMRGNHRRLVFDDYLQYLPVATSLMLGCTGVKARHSFGDRALILATSYAALAVLTNVPKWCIDEKRPEYAAHNSFPSGHTATAFMGAELVRIEYGGWSAVGAYAVASGVAILRMYNGRHWLHDVVAGAGVGILCARVGEWSCPLWKRAFQKREKENSVRFSPMVSPVGGGYFGFALNCSF